MRFERTATPDSSDMDESNVNNTDRIIIIIEGVLPRQNERHQHIQHTQIGYSTYKSFNINLILYGTTVSLSQHKHNNADYGKSRVL